jgi:DNA-directed RNA polymerase subunit beta'
MAGGITATVGELAMDRGKITQLLKQFERQLMDAKPGKERRELAQSGYEELRPKLEKLLDAHMEGRDVGYSDIIASGAGGSKGGKKQLMDIIVSPVLVKDENDMVVPAVIKTSYGSGMSPSDYVLTTPGARAGMVAKSLSTALPGFLAKEIAGNVGSARVMIEDCGTHEGITLPLSDPDVDLLDRHLLVDAGQFKRNEAVTPAMLSVLRKKRIAMIQVRSPMTCEADSPPCQMCAGRDATGGLHPIGANIGYNYGQSVGERSTQLTLRSFHSGGSIGAGDSITAGFMRLRELLSAPDIVRNQGTLSDVSGKVSDIHPAPQGGWYVKVGTAEHYVAAGRAVIVRVGQMVEKGDPLSNGSYRPQELAAKKGLLVAQQYVVDEARKSYAIAGATVRKPVLEVVVAATMRNMEITDDGGEEDLAPGDVVSENDFRKRQMRNPAIQGRPFIPGISRKPLLTTNDLLERLNFQRLEDSLHEVPATAGRSDLLGTKSPIPGLAYGAMFRENEEITSPFHGSNPFTKRAELDMIEDDGT